MWRDSLIQEVDAWSEKLAAGWRAADDFLRTAPLKGRIRRILIGGMGGSGVVGRLFHDLSIHAGYEPIAVVDSPILPRDIAEDTLIVLCSYSGMTWEVLELFEQAVMRNVPLLCVTRGGALAVRAGEHAVPLLTMPASATPRSALGLFVGIVAAIAERFQVYPGADLLDALSSHWREVAPCLQQSGEYAAFLEQLSGEKRPFRAVWGVSGDTGAAAYRAQTQYNENSKMAVATFLFPELAHNLLVGLSTEPYSALLLATSFLPHPLKEAVGALQTLCERRGVALYKPELFGDTWEKQVFYAVWWTDYASCMVGLARGAVLSETVIIDELKQLFAKRVSVL